MGQQFIISISEEQSNYLHRLGMDLEAKIFIIDRLISDHKSDTNADVINSEVFKYYQHGYEEAFTQWSMAKKEFQNTVLKPIIQEKTGLDKPNFEWQIVDFEDNECIVTMVE